MSEIACLRSLTRAGLLERLLITSYLKESVGNTKVHCAVETFRVMMAASMFVQDETDGM